MVDTKTVQIRAMPAGLWKRVRVEAVRRGQTVAEFVTEAITNHLSKGRK